MKNTSIPAKKVGLREIASAANVSLATASRVLRGNSRVSPDIQKAVLDGAKRLGIDPAQRNKARTLAFLLSNRAVLHAFHSRILSGAEEHCAAHGWNLVFVSFKYSAQVPSEELHPPKLVLRNDLVRGVILAGANSINLLEQLAREGVPFSALGNNVTDGEKELADYDMVFASDIQGSEDATRYLIDLGHRHIAFVGNTRLPWFARCFAGYSRAMNDAGLKLRQSGMDSKDEAESGYLGTKSLLASDEPVTAILAGNDPTAHGVYKALRDRGITIPDDISVVGCDDTVGSWLYPALTTTREFPEQLGTALAELLLNRIADPEAGPQRVSIPTELIKRDSCAPPNPGYGSALSKAAQGAERRRAKRS